MPRIRLAFWMIVLAMQGSMALAQNRTISLDNLQFVPPSGQTNQIDLTLDTDVFGPDTDTAIISGMAIADLDVAIQGTDLVPTGLTFNGGRIALSDVNFSYFFNTVQISTMGLAGVPGTIVAPSPINGGQFDATDHQVLVNEGTVEAPNASFDFSAAPFPAVGAGVGSVDVTPVGMPVGNDYSFDVTVQLPISFNETFLVPDVPLVGEINATLTGQGVAVSTQRFTITILDGDYNDDGRLDCMDVMLLEDAVAQGTDLAFDANGDGNLSIDDVQFWVEDIRMALPGDGNLDGVVDGADFLIWNGNKFTATQGWCSGDFDYNSVVDAADFIIWNANKFTTEPAPASNPVPEPVFGAAWALGIMLLARRWGSSL